MPASAPALPAPPVAGFALPAAVAAAGDRASYRFLEFFAAHIRNPNTRAAYLRAVHGFFDWAAAHGLDALDALGPHHVAAYIEVLGRTRSAPTVKQHLAALRMLFDWLVVGQALAFNPAASVRGPKHSAKRGKTPVLLGAEAGALLDAIPDEDAVGLRDRALIGILVYGFARIGAALGMNLEDVYSQGRRLWLRLHEKAGKRHEMPAHHRLEWYLDAYLAATPPEAGRKTPLFRSAHGRTGRLGSARLQRSDALRMIKRRARQVGISTPIGCHTFRATGITAYLAHGGSLEQAQRMAAHESPRTTKLYDRTSDRVNLVEVERIILD